LSTPDARFPEGNLERDNASVKGGEGMIRNEGIM
jgi:hypothetical protein